MSLGFEVPPIVATYATYLIFYVLGCYAAYNLGKDKAIKEFGLVTKGEEE